MTEIIPGIHRLQIPIPDNPLGYTNTYLVRGNNENLLIDPGVNTDEALSSLKKGLSEIGIGFEDVTKILATHFHGDHYGLASRVKKFSQAKTLLHQLDRDFIQLASLDFEKRFQQAEHWLRINGAPNSELPQMQMLQRISRPTTLPLPDVALQGDETLSIDSFNFKVLWTPGHSPGHISLYEPTREIFFSGDFILPVITPNISRQPQPGLNPLGDYLNSLNKVKDLEVTIVLPGHESPFSDLQKRIKELFEHHERRKSEILETIKSRPKTAYEIAEGVTWMIDFGGVSFQELAYFDKRMAVMETLAHLESMRQDEKITKLTKNDIIHYQPA
jgi:glyoxylase-like metal-dependent hydrolase (beta-lactamase superfamily II)